MNSTYNAHEYLTKATELVISIQQTLKDPANNYTNAQRLKIIPQTYELLAIIGLLVGKLETLESELTEYKHQKDGKETVSKLDQERRDNEMFQRLASDTNTNTNDQEEGSPVLLQGYSAVTELEGISESVGPPERAADKSPQDILDSVDRYFRIPFLRPGATEECRGWRYTHFRGQYVARQMELHPDMTPMLLTAGKDKQICELSLKETGLTRKPWAEILEQEFLSEWTRHGGADI